MKHSLIALCLTLAACANKPGTPKVRIANVGTGLLTWCMPISLAQTLGYYREEGVDVELENVASVVKALQALIGGSADVAGIVFSQDIQMAAEGQHLRSFFVINQRDTKVLFAAPSAIERIRSVNDLKGASIGVPALGSHNHLWLAYYLGARGIGKSDLHVVSVGAGATSFSAIEDGRVDAAVLSGGDHFRLLRRHPDLRILLDVNTRPGMIEAYGSEAYAGGTLSAKQEWLDRNPDAARRLTRALQRTHQWIATHSPEQIREQLPESFRSQDAAMDVEIIRWSLPSFTADGRMPKDAPAVMKRVLDAAVDNVRNAKIDLASTWTNDLLPDSK